MDSIWGNTTQYHQIQWGWPIAVYLFLAGLSAGSLISALLVKWSSKYKQEWDGLVKAGALLALPAIGIGQGLLVVDLGKPLSFYLLMLHFQLHSVMSIGVILLMLYSALAVLFMAIVFKATMLEQDWAEWWFKPLLPLIEWFEEAGIWVEWLMCLSAISIAAYTGFLLSALVAKPLLNVPVLPLLFLISGMSAGVAANILTGITLFKSEVQHHNLRYLLSLDMKLIPAELFILFLLFTGLFNMGGSYASAAQQALSIGIWAKIFWFGIVGIGLLLPVIVAYTSLHGFEQAQTGITVTSGGGTSGSSVELPVGTLLLNSLLVLTGVVLLRFYILFAGQIFTGH